MVIYSTALFKAFDISIPTHLLFVMKQFMFVPKLFPDFSHTHCVTENKFLNDNTKEPYSLIPR